MARKLFELSFLRNVEVRKKCQKTLDDGSQQKTALTISIFGALCVLFKTLVQSSNVYSFIIGEWFLPEYRSLFYCADQACILR